MNFLKIGKNTFLATLILIFGVKSALAAETKVRFDNCNYSRNSESDNSNQYLRCSYGDNVDSVGIHLKTNSRWGFDAVVGLNYDFNCTLQAVVDTNFSSIKNYWGDKILNGKNTQVGTIFAGVESINVESADKLIR